MLRFVKGHGTENDFVLLPDSEGALDLTPALARALCDRRAGIGADGVLRVVRTAKAPDSPASTEAEWFMDYRNADGSVAEMCGNGIRVYARYLVESGLAEPGDLTLATRDGDKRVHLAATGDVTVHMGAARILGASSAVIGGRTCAGTHIDMGNPHLVCLVDDDLGSWDLTQPPTVDAATFPAGVNVEIVSSRGPQRVAMRVHERGVGETRSCGTGACAVAVAMSQPDAAINPQWTVEVPGGRLAVHVDGDSVLLTGPAVIVAAGALDEGWLSATCSPNVASIKPPVAIEHGENPT